MIMDLPQVQQKMAINGEAPKKPPRLKAINAAKPKLDVECVTAQDAKSKKRLQFQSPLHAGGGNTSPPLPAAAASTRRMVSCRPAETTSITLPMASKTNDGGEEDVAAAAKKRTTRRTTNDTTSRINKPITSAADDVCNRGAAGAFPTLAKPGMKCVKIASLLTARSATTAPFTTTVERESETATATAAADGIKVVEGVEVGGVEEDSGGAKSRLVRGCTSLMYACQHGDTAEVLAQLRSRPERIRQRDSRNKNALHYCAAQNAETRELVAAASIAVAAPDLLESADEDGFTPLHLAVIQGNLAMVNLLLANKADVNAVDNEGHSVVHWATVCGEVEALRSVLAAGANIAIPDLNGGTPLHYAAQMCGANVDNKVGQANAIKLALEILGILLSHPHSSVDVQDKDGRQPLLWAASAGSAKAVIALVKAGARVESADKDGLTALHCAASRGHTECIDTLISLCGAPTDLIDSNGCTALHYAVTLGHADATARLLDLDADPNRQDRKGRTPAHCGCSKGQFETVKLLKERGANLWLRNAKGDLPVHEASMSGRRELVEWLLEQRPKQVNTTSNDGRSLLHIAALNDYTDVCKTLLDYGGDINAIYRNSKGVVYTPLDCALQKGHRSTAKFLQSHGGLPAGKLRLAARRSNPFQDVGTDMVRPLRYVEKEELHDLQNSKKYVVYLKHSDSEGPGGEGDSNCSCHERTYRREQKFAHTCRRHQRHRRQARRRTSSCGAPKESQAHDSGETDICRSKSNIEIRRRKSHERYASSSEWEDRGEEDNEDDEDSCENCCYHKRQKQRVIRRKPISRRRSKEREGHDRSSEKESSPEKLKVREVEVVQDKEKDVDQPTKKDGKEIDAGQVSLPQSATTRTATATLGSSGKEGTFIKSAEENESLDVEAQSIELTDEEGKPAAELVTTKVDVHHVEEKNSVQQVEGTETNAEVEINGGQEELSVLAEEMKKEVDQVMKIAALALESDASNGGNGNEPAEKVENPEGAENPEEKQAVASEDTTVKGDEDAVGRDAPTPHTEEKVPPNLTETPATPIVTPLPSPTPVQIDQIASSAVAAIEPAQPIESQASATEVVPVTTSVGDIRDPEAATAQPIGTDQSVDAGRRDEDTATSKPTAATEMHTATEQSTLPPTPTASDLQQSQKPREQEARRSFTLLPSDSAEDDATEDGVRKSSFQILKSDDDALTFSGEHHEDLELSDSQVFKIVSGPPTGLVKPFAELEASSADDEHRTATGVYENDDHNDDEEDKEKLDKSAAGLRNRHGVGNIEDSLPGNAVLGVYDYSNGRKRRMKKRVKSGPKTRSNWKNKIDDDNDAGNAQKPGSYTQVAHSSKDQDSGFEPSPRAMKSKIPTPRNVYTAHVPRRHIYATLDGRSCSSRLEGRKPGERGACDMTAVTRSIQRNIRRYYMERKIFQHLLELKSLQIRSTKLNEAVLVKRAVDDYHKSCAALGGETGTRLRRYPFSDYSFKNFELFLYETLKALQKPGTYNFQNINEVYEEAERRLSPDYNAYEKALQCTTKTHRCLHAAHAYTGIPCAAYIPMMNHHTMPKFGFGPYKKTGVGSFYLPKILTSGGCGASGSGCSGGKVALELSHGKSKQLISLPSDKLDSNKRYYVTFTVKESGGGMVNATSTDAHRTDASGGAADKQQTGGCCGGVGDATGK